MNLNIIYAEISRLYRYVDELNLSQSLENISGGVENINSLSSSIINISGTIHHPTWGLNGTNGLPDIYTKANSASVKSTSIIDDYLNDATKGLFKTYDNTVSTLIDTGLIRSTDLPDIKNINTASYNILNNESYGLNALSASMVTHRNFLSGNISNINTNITNSIETVRSSLSGNILTVKNSTDKLDNTTYGLSALNTKITYPSSYFLNTESFISYSYSTGITSSFNATRNNDSGLWTAYTFTTDRIILFDDTPDRSSGFVTNTYDRINLTGLSDCFIAQANGHYEISWNIVAQLLGGYSPCYIYFLESQLKSSTYKLLYNIPITGGTTTNYYSSNGSGRVYLQNNYAYSFVYPYSTIRGIDLFNIMIRRLN
jgi:hypothetical protein